MLRAISVGLITGLLLACQGVQHIPMESIQVKTLKVPGTDLAYVEEGRGQTVVFVHGGAGDWRTWDALRPYISTQYRFVAYSLRHHYPNQWTDDGKNYSVVQHAEDLTALIRALNAGKVHLVGGSYGGRIAVEVALRDPELLRSLVVSDPVGLIGPTTPEGKAAASELQKDIAKSIAAANAGDARQAAILLFDAVSGEAGAFQKAPPAQQQRWLDNARPVPQMYAAAPPPRVTCDQLRSLKLPVMVMRGENTRAAYRYSDEALVNCLPKGTETAVVPNSSHMWYPVNPKAGAEAIVAFIAKQ